MTKIIKKTISCKDIYIPPKTHNKRKAAGTLL